MERFFMERLKYIVEDSTIAELLGVQNFTNKESAILELVKNAYDAQANNVSITFSDRSIVIIDDGIGMSKSTICENWMHVGKSDKGYSLSGTEDNDGRVLAGSKGVGRFALARLGASVIVYSAKKGEIPVKWTTDWSESILDDLTNEENLPLGTRIEISALRDRWTEKSIKNLINYLSITCNDDRMQIKIYPNFGKGVSYIFKKPQIGKNFVTQIGLFYDASELKLYYTIERNKPLKKWSNAVLSDEEIDLLNRITNQYTTIAKLSDSAPGIVTGANNKFILTKEEVDQYECTQYVKPIISKGVMAKNKFEVNHALISELASAGKKVYLLDLVGTKPDELPVSLKNYLSIVASTKRNGVEIQKSYKCSKRKPWYGVPIVKSGRVIFFKRYDLCPRISTNPAEIYTTDIAYNLRLHEGIDPESLVFCFYNSLTLAQCEFVGRYYAGGVSELTPNEFRTISVPYRQIKPCDIERAKQMFNDNEDLNQIVAFVNSKTLEADLSTDEITRLNAIRSKLIKRRK